MEERERHEILEAMRRWMHRHPQPNEPVLNLGDPDGSVLSPKQMVDAVEHRTVHGEAILNMIELAAANWSLAEVLASFDAGTQNAATAHR
jgi:hypothetical protein